MGVLIFSTIFRVKLIFYMVSKISKAFNQESKNCPSPLFPNVEFSSFGEKGTPMLHYIMNFIRVSVTIMLVFPAEICCYSPLGIL